MPAKRIGKNTRPAPTTDVAETDDPALVTELLGMLRDADAKLADAERSGSARERGMARNGVGVVLSGLDMKRYDVDSLELAEMRDGWAADLART